MNIIRFSCVNLGGKKTSLEKHTHTNTVRRQRTAVNKRQGALHRDINGLQEVYAWESVYYNERDDTLSVMK